jgi:hypothetical protein
MGRSKYKEQNLEVRLIKPAEEEKWEPVDEGAHNLGFERCQENT